MPRCRQLECKVSEGGECLEDRGDQCSHLVEEEAATQAEVSQDVGEAGGTSAGEELESLPSGKKLTLSEVAAILRAQSPRVVVIVGSQASGKTTLLARIHEYFHVGPVGAFSFAGSRTLLGFGLVSWNAMITSGRYRPDTERTKHVENDTCLHLSVRPHPSQPITQLLLNDIAGESFADATSDDDACGSLELLSRADHVVLLIDGRAASDIALRHGEVRGARDFVKRACQSGQVGPQTIVDLVLSKADVLSAAGSTSMEFATRKRQEIASELAGHCAEVRQWTIAARPEGEFLETAEEITQLFGSWVQDTRRGHVPSETGGQPPRPEWRDFCRYQVGSGGDRE